MVYVYVYVCGGSGDKAYLLFLCFVSMASMETMGIIRVERLRSRNYNSCNSNCWYILTIPFVTNHQLPWLPLPDPHSTLRPSAMLMMLVVVVVVLIVIVIPTMNHQCSLDQSGHECRAWFLCNQSLEAFLISLSFFLSFFLFLSLSLSLLLLHIIVVIKAAHQASLYQRHWQPVRVRLISINCSQSPVSGTDFREILCLFLYIYIL